jgi:preprotein translocase subunit Sec61beta
VALELINLNTLPKRRPVPPLSPTPGIGAALASTLAAIGAGAAGFANQAIQLRQTNQRYALDRAMLDAQSKVQLATLDVAARQGDFDAVRELSYWNQPGALRNQVNGPGLLDYYVRQQGDSPLASPTLIVVAFAAVLGVVLLTGKK